MGRAVPFGFLAGRGRRRAAVASPSTGLVMVLLAHAVEDGLFGAAAVGAQLLLGPVCDAPAPLNGDFGTPVKLAPLPGRTVRAAQSSLFHVLGTTGVLARFAARPVRDAQPTLHDTVLAPFDGALAAQTFAGATRSQSGS